MSSVLQYSKDHLLVTGKDTNRFGVDIAKDKRVYLDENGITLNSKDENPVYIDTIESSNIAIDEETHQASSKALPSSLAVMNAIAEGGLKSLWPFTLEVENGATPTFSIKYNVNEEGSLYLAKKFRFRPDAANPVIDEYTDAVLTNYSFFCNAPIESVRIAPLASIPNAADDDYDAEEIKYLKRIPGYCVREYTVVEPSTYAYKYAKDLTAETLEYAWCYCVDNEAGIPEFYHTDDLTKAGKKFAYINEVPEPLFYIAAFKEESDVRGFIQMKITFGTAERPVVIETQDTAGIIANISYINGSQASDIKTKPYFMYHYLFDVDFRYSKFYTLNGAFKNGAIACKNIDFVDYNNTINCESAFEGRDVGCAYTDGAQVSPSSLLYVSFQHPDQMKPREFANFMRYARAYRLDHFLEDTDFLQMNFSETNALAAAFYTDGYMWRGSAVYGEERAIITTRTQDNNAPDIDLSGLVITRPINMTQSFGYLVAKNLKVYPNYKPLNLTYTFLSSFCLTLSGVHTWDTSACRVFNNCFIFTNNHMILNIANWSFGLAANLSEFLSNGYYIHQIDELFINALSASGHEQVTIDSVANSITIRNDAGNVSFTYTFPDTITVEGGVDMTDPDTPVSQGWVKKSDESFTTTAPEAGHEDEYVPNVYHIYVSQSP